MKMLYLVRHAKSDWGSPTLQDHDRPLNERGESDLPRMGAELEARGFVPDAVLTSTALRASTTATSLAEALGFPAERIDRDRGLYLASVPQILRKLSLVPEEAGSAMLLGHNPGLHEAVLALDLNASVPEFPTLAFAALKLRIDRWEEINVGCADLAALIVPRQLAG